MYEEFERAMTGRTPRRGMSPLAWFGAAFAVLVVVSVVGVGFALNRAVHRMGDFARDFDVGRELSNLSRLADVGPQTRLLSMDPDEGLAFLETLDAGDPAESFLREMMRGNLDLLDMDPFHRVRHVAEGVKAQASASVDRGDVRISLDRRDGGGSLVIDAGGEQTRFDLVRGESGGQLTIDSPDGRTRISLVGGDEGGTLSIDSEEGEVRFDLRKRGDGAEILMDTDGRSVRLGIGDGAGGMPGWVADFGVFPEAPRPVYSLDSAEGALGAVAWQASEAPSEVLARYKTELEARGYELRDRYRHSGEDADEGAFWARNESQGRMVFVVAHHEEAGRTQVLLGFGERR